MIELIVIAIGAVAYVLIGVYGIERPKHEEQK